MGAIGPEKQRLSPIDRDNLVAYLDGELNEAENRALATKLTASPTARREIDVLEKTWELLEYLPRPNASETFAERTLSEIRTLAERGERRSSKFRILSVRLAQSFLWIVGSALVGASVYLIVLRGIPNPSERLSRDLPLAEHLDEYRDVHDIKFLNELMNSTEFNEATATAANSR